MGGGDRKEKWSREISTSRLGTPVRCSSFNRARTSRRGIFIYDPRAQAAAGGRGTALNYYFRFYFVFSTPGQEVCGEDLIPSSHGPPPPPHRVPYTGNMMPPRSFPPRRSSFSAPRVNCAKEKQSPGPTTKQYARRTRVHTHSSGLWTRTSGRESLCKAYL